MEKAKETHVLSPTIVCSFTITGFLPEISTARSQTASGKQGIKYMAKARLNKFRLYSLSSKKIGSFPTPMETCISTVGMIYRGDGRRLSREKPKLVQKNYEKIFFIIYI